MKALVFFYELDAKNAEPTIAGLHSLVMSWIMKNPIYENVIKLMKVIHSDKIDLL